MDWMNLDRLTPLIEHLRASPRLQALGIFLASLLAAKVVDFAITRFLKRWVQLTRTDLDDRLVAILHRPLFYSIMLVGSWLAVQKLSLSPTYELLLLRALKTAGIFIWLAFALRASTIVLQILSRLERRVPLLQSRTVPLFENTAKILLAGGAIYFLFLTWGIDIGAWLLSAGVVGIAVAFAAKDTLANLFSGIFILADAPYEVGDFIILDTGERGRVTQVGLRSTRLLTRDDIEITIPNAVIANAKIVNESGGPWEKERVRLKIGVAYGSDVDQVRKLLFEIAAGTAEVSDDPSPRIRFRAFGESSLDFELLCWIDRPVLRGRVLDLLHTRIYKEFQTQGVEIPFPQRDVWLKQPSPPEEP
jgi:small-conductance mechanosensitive channel